LLAKQYKSIANGIGEVCVVNKYFNQTFGGYTKPKLYFIRGGIIICITMFDENVNVETIARIIDQQLIKSQETEEHK
jgi:predicted acetyltransferase